MKLTMKSLVFLLVTLLWKSNSTYISIRGGVKPELLPMAYTKGWEVWTYENNMLTPVENDAEEGWVNPSSFTTLFLPSDLPKVTAVIVLRTLFTL